MINFAIDYIALGQYEAAALVCQQAIVDDPQQLSSYWYLGLVRLLQQDQAEAEAVWFSATVAIDPIVVEAGLVELMQILQSEVEPQLQRGQPHLAEQLCWQLLGLEASLPDVHLQLGRAVALQGRLEEAIEHWQKAIELQSDLAEAYCQQATAFQKLEQWEKAIGAYKQAIELQPNSQSENSSLSQPIWRLHYNLGLCLGQQHCWQEAIEQFNQAIQIQPDFAPAYGDRGWALLQLGHRDAAMANWQTALWHKSGYAQTYILWVNTWVNPLNGSGLSPETIQRAKWLEMLSSLDLLSSSPFDSPDFNKADLNEADFDKADQVAHQSLGTTPTTQPVELQATQLNYSSDRNYPVINCEISHRFYETTWDWVKVQEITDRYIALDQPSLIELNSPKTLDREVHFSFRFGQLMPLPGTFVVNIPDGKFWLNSNQTSNAIWTADHQLLGDLSPEFPLLSPDHPDKHPRHHSRLLTQEISPDQKIDGTVAVLSGLTNDMYFHWMFDVLPRLDLLQRSGINHDRIDYFLVSNHLPFQQETLQILNIPKTKILETDHHLYIQAKQLIVPSYPSSPAWMSYWVCQWLRKVFFGQTKIAKSRSDRLYITRKIAANRRIINEPAVIALLSQLGFRCVDLESLSVIEQAALLANAEVVVSPHGSGLTNTIFCQPGTKVIEIFSPHYVYPCYWLISNLLELDYYYLTGTIPEGFYLHKCLYPDARTEDILLDLVDLQQVLNLAGVI